MNATTDPTPISPESIKVVQEKLRAFDIEWANKLAEKMYPEAVGKKKPFALALRKVYNIANGQIKTNSYKVLFVTQAYELLKEYQEQQEGALKALEEIEK